MATYEYRCKRCGHTFERGMTVVQHERHHRPACPKCHHRTVRQVPSKFQAVTARKT
ncbi:MAG: FmdB family zinc ribbon protein [Planctomycetota bacterium]|jgi:putative FmdB family regulatory protein